MRKGEPAKPAPPHGDHARYVSRYFKCRCDDCKSANTQYMSDYRERVKNNGGRPLRDEVRSVPQGIEKHSRSNRNGDY